MGSPSESLCRKAAWRIASNMSRSLLLAAPSVPRATVRPAFIAFTTGAAPLASFMLLSGLCDNATPCVFRIAMSASVRCTPCAATAGVSQNPRESKYAAGERWCFAIDSTTSSRVSARCVSSGTPNVRARSRVAFSVSASTVYIEWAATVATTRGSPLNACMKRSARARPSAGVLASATGNPMIVWPSTPRMPASFVAFATSSSK